MKKEIINVDIISMSRDIDCRNTLCVIWKETSDYGIICITEQTEGLMSEIYSQLIRLWMVN